ncbi:MAG: hypothetical protein DKT66_09400 [Candidatus Melainabacteria bacterium]|nr:MAG: hypothetical protein DKT66_09400 [Candidatus Melainabacteria bacterium]
MKSYLVKDLTDEQLSLLTNAGVQHYPWDSGIMFEETQLDTVLAVLNATGAKSKSKYENVYKLKLTFKKRKKEGGKKDEVDEETLRREAERLEYRKRYIKACESRTKSILDAAASTASGNRKKLAAAKQRFVTSKRTEVFGASKIAGNEIATQTLIEELERVRMVQGVQAVHVVPNRLLIATEILCATDPESGLRHEIGQFLITVYLDGSEDGIRWQNNSRRVDGVRERMHAPTVFSDGRAGAAEIHATVMELIARLELSTVAELAIQFIENPEANEYGKYVSKWPML